MESVLLARDWEYANPPAPLPPPVRPIGASRRSGGILTSSRDQGSAYILAESLTGLCFRANQVKIYNDNLIVLRERYPELAQRLDAFADQANIVICKAKDGGVAYAVRQNGQLIPVSDPIAPTARMQAQFDQWSAQLADYTRPILVVGLYPGNELLCLFDQAENNQTPHCPQPIWVCVDSTICLSGFLQTWDARRVLESPRVRFFWHSEMPAQIQWLREHPEFPHLFTLITGAPDKTLNQVMPPLAALIQEREAGQQKMIAENEAYYDAITDHDLAAVIENTRSQRLEAGGRKPRLLMPTVAWSTYVQYSARDTAAAFEELGWETRILRMEAMLTPYYLVKTIHEFKPDIFMFIDHMRYEAEELYPKNMMFVAWIQDDMPNLQCQRAGEKLREYAARGRRDLVIGYIDRLENQYNFPKDRLAPILIPANPRIFHPVQLTEADRAKHECDLAFMTNTSMPSEQVVEQKILPTVEPLGITRTTCLQIHNELWEIYRSGKTITNRNEFLDWLLQYPEFAAAWKMESDCRPSCAPHSPLLAPPFSKQQDELVRLFYWRLNDTIYRHIVLEWAVELAESAANKNFALHLYGHGWEKHPRFAGYARGPLKHGPELNKAYQAARYCLHLNIAQGMHQRVWEILAAGGRPLIRAEQNLADNAQLANMRALAGVLVGGKTLADLSPEQQADLNGHMFQTACGLARHKSSALTPAELWEQAINQQEANLRNNPKLMIPDFEKYSFHDQATFYEHLLNP